MTYPFLAMVSAETKFYVDFDGKWRWEQTFPEGSVLLESDEGFQSLKECVSDAWRTRYTPGHPLTGNGPSLQPLFQRSHG